MNHFDRALFYRLLAGLEQVLSNQRTMSRRLAAIKLEEDIMALDLTDLTTRVAANTDASASAVILMNGLKASLDTAIAALPTDADKASLQALSDAIGVNSDALAAAVVADTPAAAADAVAAVDPAPSASA